MKKLITIVFVLFSCIAHSQIVNIPDANFKSYLINNVEVNTNGDSEIQVSEANAFTGTLAFQFFFVSDLTGIEAFVNLSVLDCGDNELTSLDLSANTALTQLYCYDNFITNLDISANTALTALDCRNNTMTSLTLNQNLTYLQCTFNQLENLDVSQNLQLTTLRCFANNLMSLDLSANIELTSLYTNNNNLEQLDLSNNNALTIIECNSNNLIDLFVDNSNNTNVTGFTALFNPNLECIQVDDEVYSNTNWTNIDSSSNFSEDCASLSINEFDLEFVKIFPVPAFHNLNVIINENVSYFIKSMHGELIKKGHLLKGKRSIDISKLSNGIYFISFESEEDVIMTKKWIKS